MLFIACIARTLRAKSPYSHSSFCGVVLFNAYIPSSMQKGKKGEEEMKTRAMEDMNT
jgi:hypothetical protein